MDSYYRCKVIPHSVSTIFSAIIGLALTPSVSAMANQNTVVFQAGGFEATQGQAQDVGINGLIGDRFTVNNPHANNVVLGLAYYHEGFNQGDWQVLYGINAFYFAPTSVQGNVIQENAFNNLAYQYSISNYPIYLAGKALFHLDENTTATFDAGIGPNLIKTSNFSETSLDGGFTIPDAVSFSGQTSVDLSFTAGVGIKFQRVFGELPLECSYRFFYLGEGNLSKDNDQFNSTLSTGRNYANALLFSVAF